MKKLTEKNFFLLFLLICFIILTIIGTVHLISSYYVNHTIYENHRNLTMRLLKTAENGITHYISEIENDMTVLSKSSDIIYFGDEGKAHVKRYWQNGQDVYTNVSRVDSRGKLQYTYPENPQSIGKDLLFQEHNKKLFDKKIPVISRPFMAVQGYKAIAVAIPVFKKDSLVGCISGLIPFDRMWELYVRHIKPTDNSFVILANHDGGIIYSPEYMCQYDNVREMMDMFRFEDSLSFDSTSDYALQRISVIKDLNNNLKSSRFSLIKSSFKIGDDLWYLLVYTPDEEIKSIYQLVFKSQTIFAYLIIFLLVFTAISFVRILNQKIEEKNRLVQEIFEEKKLSEGEKEFLENIIKSIIKLNGLFLFVLKSSGEIAFHNQQIPDSRNFYDLTDASKRERVKESLDFIYEKNRVTAMMIELEINSKQTNILFNISSFTFKNERFIVLMGFEYSRIKDVSVISDIFADSFKKWYTNENMLCFIESSGKIIASNRSFQKKFSKTNLIQMLKESDSTMPIEESVKDVYENVSEIRLNFQSEGNNYKMTLVPIVNEFLKVEYIAVEIS
ncbi:MAG: cache domain-containing protein [bacterium]|nr:cache domain-containing protein [bacterium]